MENVEVVILAIKAALRKAQQEQQATTEGTECSQ